MKKKYLYCVVFIAATAKCTALTYNGFITCNITEKVKPVAAVEENPTFYVELNNEIDEVMSKEVEEVMLKETEEIMSKETEEVMSKEANEVQENIELSYVDYDTPPDNSFKSYMDYRTITDTTSKQYELQKQADTDWCGMRMIDDKYCVAVGSYYSTSVGQAIDVIMQNGNTIHCIVADLKKDIHTDSTNRQNPNGSIVEFLVDTNILHRRIQKVGDISYFDTVWKVNLFSGEIDIIRVYE